MKASPEQLDAMRRALAERHRQRPDAASAFDLARLAYLAGDYDEALQRFGEAHARAPDDPGVAIALVRAASAMGRHDVERATLAAGLRAAPGYPPLELHAALLDVPGDLAAARDRLRSIGGDAGAAEFAHALDHLLAGQPMPLPAGAPERAIARAASMRWVQARSNEAAVFHGLPVAVLEAGLDAACVDGLVLEFGVYHGRSLRLIAGRTAGGVHGFDSFEGLPEAWNEAEGAGAYSTGGRRPRVDANVQLHAGWFRDTLPPFLAAHAGPVRLAHVDCDLYSSTRDVLAALAPRLVAGSVLVFDDLLGYPGFEAHELRALEEFVAETGWRYRILAAALLGREVAIQLVD